MHHATFVLSTGRCGTQWLAATLAEAYPGRITVAHEPLHARYQPRQALRGAGDASPQAQPPEVVLRHADAIEAGLLTRPYIECGHPCWSTLPWLADRFRGRVRIVHLLRHPVPTSYSWLTHQAYQPPLLPHLAEKVLLSPFDEGVRFGEYRERWPQLTPFEKCLYYWAEVNAFALDLQSRLDLPWLRLRFEDLFQAEGADQLLTFLGLPPSDHMFGRRQDRVDAYRWHVPALAGGEALSEHPRVIELAAQFGYALDAIDEAALARRYLIPGDPQLG